jgi:hypothetical protein
MTRQPSWELVAGLSAPPGGRRRPARSSFFRRLWRMARCRHARSRLLFDADDERAQPRRRGLARRSGRRGQRRRNHLGEAPGSRNVLAPADDAIGERNARFTTLGLAHLEARGALAAYMEPAAIALRGGEYTIVAALDHFSEVRIELDHRAPALELRCAEILEPEIWARRGSPMPPRRDFHRRHPRLQR